MKTLYIDVYFLINFTVDMIAIHFASVISKISISALKLTLLSCVLSAFAVAAVLLPFNETATMLAGLLFIPCMFFLFLKKASIKRRIKFCLTFFVLSFLIGGVVYYFYIYLSARIPENLISSSVNQGLLFLAVVILIVLALIKLFTSVFSSSVATKCARVRLNLNGEKIDVDSFVDTGNLLTDPVDMTPVMVIKYNAAKKLFPYGIPMLEAIDTEKFGSHVRLIPVNKNGSSELLVGFRPDSATVRVNDRDEEIKIIFIIDREGGTFGGFDGLLPASVLE